MKSLSNVLFVNFVSKALYSYLVKYPTPMNINYLWNFGFMSAIFLVIQIISGLFLTFFFTAHVDLAFFSVEHIMRDINYGWLIRYVHANGASFFFFLVYVHILKGIYYGSYYFPRTLVWFTGCIIYILMMGTAFLGYVLPWGQMSYWAATVITNFVTVIPVVGKDIVYWIRGGYSINNATLSRFFSLHYLLPFVIAVLSVYHIYQLHKSGSSNELGVRSHYLNKISFYPYFLVKDFFGLFVVLFFFFIFVFFFPEAFNHSDNYIKANPLVTPAHIVPEWYFLPLYGILRSILNKTYGIIIMFVALLVLFLLPFIDKSLIKNKTFKPFNRTLFWFFAYNFLFLGYLGSQSPVYPYIELGLICSHFHLLYFFLLIPLSVIFETSFFFSFSFKPKKIKLKKGQYPTYSNLQYFCMAYLSLLFMVMCIQYLKFVTNLVHFPTPEIPWHGSFLIYLYLKWPFLMFNLNFFYWFFIGNPFGYISLLPIAYLMYRYDSACLHLRTREDNYYPWLMVYYAYVLSTFCLGVFYISHHILGIPAQLVPTDWFIRLYHWGPEWKD